MSGKDLTHPRIGILVVAYNAESTLRATLDRVPVDFRHRIAEVIVLDDASHDDTFACGQAWAERPDTPQTLVVRHAKNLGYGGNQKAGYGLALERGLDIVVLLHGDGQYAPEMLPEMVAPLERGECDAVMGSRMMKKGAARNGGMPLYKRVGNRILTRIENSLLGAELSEFHSGYRAYSTSALRDIPFDRNTDDFDFDTQIIVQLLHTGKRILEIPIPTFYGDEICYVNGMRYAKNVIKDVLAYRLMTLGIGKLEWVPKPQDYALRDGDVSAHDGPEADGGPASAPAAHIPDEAGDSFEIIVAAELSSACRPTLHRYQNIPARRRTPGMRRMLKSSDADRPLGPGSSWAILSAGRLEQPSEHHEMGRSDHEQTSRRHHLTIGSMALLLFAVATAATAQVMLRHGMRIASARTAHSGVWLAVSAATSPWVLVGLAVFGVSAIAWLATLSRVPLSIAYPFNALGYLGILTASVVVLHERANVWTWAGSLLVVSGLILVVLAQP